MVENWAIIDKTTHVVVNIVRWDGQNGELLWGDSVYWVKYGSKPCGPEWTYDGAKFHEPPQESEGE